MKNETLLINGKQVKEVDITSFTTSKEMIEWEELVYHAIDEKEPENNYTNLEDVFGNEFSEKWFSHRRQLTKKELKEQVKKITIDGKEFIAVKTFTVLHAGWELDSLGYVFQDNGVHKIILTSHGSPYWASNKEVEKLLQYYDEVKKETLSALSLSNK